MRKYLFKLRMLQHIVRIAKQTSSTQVFATLRTRWLDGFEEVLEIPPKAEHDVVLLALMRQEGMR